MGTEEGHPARLDPRLGDLAPIVGKRGCTPGIVGTLGTQHQALANPIPGGLWLLRLESGPERTRRARCRAALRWPLWAADWLTAAREPWDRVRVLIEDEADARATLNAIASAAGAPGKGTRANALGTHQWPVRMLARGWPDRAEPRDRARVLALEHEELPRTGRDWARIGTLARMTGIVGSNRATLGADIRWMKARQKTLGEREALTQAMQAARDTRSWIRWAKERWIRRILNAESTESTESTQSAENTEIQGLASACTVVWWKAVSVALTPRKIVRIAARAEQARRRAERWMNQMLAEVLPDVRWETPPLSGTARCVRSLTECIAWRDRTGACLPYWWCNEGMATETSVPHAIQIPGRGGEVDLTAIMHTTRHEPPEQSEQSEQSKPSHQVWIETIERSDRAKLEDCDRERMQGLCEEVRKRLDDDPRQWERTRASREQAFRDCETVLPWIKEAADAIQLRAIVREIPALRRVTPEQWMERVMREIRRDNGMEFS